MPHNNPRDPERVAKAPYNFIPLPEKVVPAQPLPDHDQFYPQPERYSGTIELDIETKSPLYTRTMMTPQVFQANGDDPRGLLGTREGREELARFFHHGEVEQPVIPGSSLRGMIRAIVEIITCSKVEWVTDKKLIYRAVGDRSALGQRYRDEILGKNRGANPNTMLYDYPSPNVKGGYLREIHDSLYIQPAQTHDRETLVHVNYADAEPVIHSYGRHRLHPVIVRPSPRVNSDRNQRGAARLYLNIAVTDQIAAAPAKGQALPPGWVRGVLVETGQMGNPAELRNHPKHMHCVIYEPAGSQPGPGESVPKEWVKIPKDLWNLYKEDLELPRDHNRTPREIKPGEPLFYLTGPNGELVYFGETMMFRLPYPHTPLDFVPPALRNEEMLDFTDAMFGYIREKKPANFPQQYAGRIKFSDARLDSAPNGLWLSDAPVTLKILSGPKPTTFQHYLEQDQPDNRGSLRHFASPTDETRIRGNKLYWHQNNVEREDIQCQDTPQGGGMPCRGIDSRPVQEQDAFWRGDKQHSQAKPVKAGVLFTSQIVFENLSAEELGALLWAVRLPTQEHCHKLGMGKPLGMGAVKITPTLKIHDRGDRYSRLFEGNDWNPGTSGSRREDEFIDDFMRFMTGQTPEMRNGFAASPRIRMLANMLHFPGPARENTRYLGLPEFRDRRVLPDPLFYGTSSAGSDHQQARTGTPVVQPNPAPGAAPSQPERINPSGNNDSTVSHPAAEELIIGSIRTVVVEDDSDTDGDLIVSFKDVPEGYDCFILKKDALGRQFRNSMRVRCEVIKIDHKNKEIYLRRVEREIAA